MGPAPVAAGGYGLGAPSGARDAFVQQAEEIAGRLGTGFLGLTTRLSAMFSQLTLADLFPRFGDAEAPVTSDVPLYGRVSVRLGANGDVQDANVRLDLGAGTINFVQSRDSILLDEATIKLRWDMLPAADRDKKGGEAISTGFDFLVLGEDGRIRTGYQFIEA